MLALICACTQTTATDGSSYTEQVVLAASKLLIKGNQAAEKEAAASIYASDGRPALLCVKLEHDIMAPFGRACGVASRAAPGEALLNVCFVTGFTCKAVKPVLKPSAAYTGKVKP